MSALDPHQRRMWRATLNTDAMLSLEEVAEALPGDSEQNRGWVLAHAEIVGEVAGTPVYRWGDVIAVIASASEQEPATPSAAWLSTKDAAGRLGISRSTLDGMVARAPRDLAGAPILSGAGQRRRRWRWNPETLEIWMRGYAEWNRPAAKAAVRPRRRGRAPTPEAGVVDWAAAAKTNGKTR